MMAKKSGFFEQTKTRNLAIILGIFIILVIAVVMFFMRRGSEVGISPAKVTKVPKGVTFEPGTKDLPKEYLKTLLQSEKLSAQSALKTGGSAIPSMLATDDQQQYMAGTQLTEQSPSQQVSQCCDIMKKTCQPISTSNLLAQWVKTGQVTPDVAAELGRLRLGQPTVSDYAVGLNHLVQAGRITPAQAKQLLDAYRQAKAVTTQLPTANNLLDQMVSQGALTPDVANSLRQLSNNDAAVADYRGNLNRLVQAGKLTQDQARNLLTAYRHEHIALGTVSPTANDLVDQMVSAGQLLPATADILKRLSDSGKPVSLYRGALNRLVREGKLTPGKARQLLNAYQQEHGEIAVQAHADQLVDQMVKAGKLTPEDATILKQLSDENASPSTYKASLDRLVSEGKLSANQAKTLLQAYRQEQVSVSPPSAANALVDQMVKSGVLSSDDATDLKQLVAGKAPVSIYKAALDHLVQAGKLPADQANQLVSAYQQEVGATAPAVSRPVVSTSSTAGIIDGLVKSGKVAPDIAAQLRDASESGESAVDYAKTLNQLVRDKKLSPSDALKLLSAYQNENPMAGVPTGAGQIAQLERQQQKRELVRQTDELKQQQVTMQQQQAQQQTQAVETLAKDLESTMNTQAHSLVAAWNPVPQKYVFHAASDSQGNGTQVKGHGASGTKDAASTAKSKGYPIVKAGSIMFAVLDTGINSDRPGPVMATIVSGKFKGAKLLGGLSITPDHERVILKFTSMTMPEWPETINIAAVAINPDTAHTAIASRVDNHYMLRYSAIFASSFLSGVADAVKNSGSTTVQDSGSSKTTYEKLNVADKLLVGIGEIGTKLSSAAQKIFNKKPTVKVDAGVGLGILFTGSVAQPRF